MLKKILVPLDGSVRAEQAIPTAARIARVYEGSVVLVQVLHPPVEHEAYMPEFSALIQTPLDAALSQAADYLKGITYRSDLADVKTEIQVDVGSPASTILAITESLSPDIIVMSSHGYTELKRWVLGSVAEKVVHHASVPVLVLRDEGPGLAVPQPDAARPLRALVALDGSPFAEAVLEPTAYLVAALAAPTQAALHLVQVLDLPLHDGQLKNQAYAVSIIEQAELEAKGYLSMIADRIFQGPLANLHLAVTEPSSMIQTSQGHSSMKQMLIRKSTIQAPFTAAI